MEPFVQYRKTHTLAQILVTRFSQFEEDEVIYNFFQDRPVKVKKFLDIGSSDGVGSSNCLKLALSGWCGVCIEPNPFLWQRLFEFYQGQHLIHPVCACVWGRSGLVNLHLNNDGLTTADDKIFQAINGKTKFIGTAFSPCITPDDIVATFGNDFDFVSIDAEGCDIEIVKASKNLLKSVSMICIETNRPKQPIEEWYQAHWKEALDYVGFTKVFHQTKVNKLMIRP